MAPCGLLGRAEERKEWLRRLLELRPRFMIAGYNIEAEVYVSPELRTVVTDGLRKAGLPEK